MANPKTFLSYSRNFEDVDIFEEEEDPQKRQDQINLSFSPPRLEESQTIEDPISQSSSPKNNHQIKRSLNHNFQKHAVVTIKKLMRIKYNYESGQCQQLAHRMWNIFMSSGVKNKKILVIIFGSATLSDPSFLKIVEKCGFEQILPFGEKAIREAQQFLRNRFIQSVNEQNVRQNLSNCRNIKLTQEFYVYFIELLKMIKSGPLIKLRISDRTAKKIENLIKIQKMEVV